MSRDKSHVAFARAKQLMPGGVNSPARAFGGVGGEPIFFERAEGAYLFDLDGNRYIDYIGSWGPMILGHGHPAIVAAVAEALKPGQQLRRADAGRERIGRTDCRSPAVDRKSPAGQLRHRGCDERRAAGARIHRANEDREVRRQLSRPRRQPSGRGRKLGCHAGRAGLAGRNSGRGRRYDRAPLQRSPGPSRTAFATCGDQIAAVIFEPVAGNMGCVMATAEFRKALRATTRKCGALLIYDEVMTGFRVAYGGAQTLFDDQPDLTTLGKIIGGGLPVGAYGGGAAVMDHVLPAGKVFQAGTLSGNPLAMAAGIAALRTLRDTNPYPQLERRSALLAAALEARGNGGGHPLPHRPLRLDDNAVLQPPAGDGLANGLSLRYEAIRPVFLGHDRPRRLHAVQPVRGAVRFRGAQRCRHRGDCRRGPRGVFERHAVNAPCRCV